jgi:hypothetical protein
VDQDLLLGVVISADSSRRTVANRVKEKLNGPKRRWEAFLKLLIRVGKKENNIAFLRQRYASPLRQLEDISVEQGFHFVPVYPDDQVLSIFIIDSDSFYGHELLWIVALALQTKSTI